MSSPPVAAGPPVWWVIDSCDAHGIETLTAWAGGQHGDGEMLQSEAATPSRLAGATRRATVRWRPDSGQIVLCRLADGVVPGDPPLWFVSLPEPAASPAAMTLVAFGTADQQPGAVLSGEAFAALPVRSDAQAGAVRWFAQASLVHQVYVAADRRRQGVGTALVYTAALWARLHGRPLLHADGHQTELGVAWLNWLPWPDRIPPLQRLMPPMTPP